MMLVECSTLTKDKSEADYDRKDRKASNTDSHISRLECLPGEIRNQIFELCIQDTLKPPKASWSTMQPLLPSSNASELSILPQWHGPVRVRMGGIGPIPLLFVSKRLSAEVASLVYSRVGSVSVGGYILQYPDGNYDLRRWNLIYPQLLNCHLRQFARSIKLKLPSTRQDLHRRNDSLRGFSITGFQTQQRPPNFESVMSVIPSLVNSLKAFERLESLEVTVTVEMTSPPDFTPLLSLYNLCDYRTIVAFVDPTSFFERRPTTWHLFVASWRKSWEDCLSLHRETKLA